MKKTALEKRVEILEALVHTLLKHPNITDHSCDMIKITDEDEETPWEVKRKPIGFVPPSKQKPEKKKKAR